MDELLDIASAKLAADQFEAELRPGRIPGYAQVLDPDGELVLNRPATTSTHNGSVLDLAGIQATRKTQVIMGGAKLSDFTLLSTLEPTALVAMTNWQAGVKNHAFSAGLSQYPHLFRNSAMGVSNLNLFEFWPYKVQVTPNVNNGRGMHLLDGFHRSDVDGFIFRPDEAPTPLEQATRKDIEPHFEFDASEIMEELVTAMTLRAKVTRKSMDLHKRYKLDFIADLPVVSTIANLATNETTGLHFTSDQQDGDSAKHSEFKNIRVAEQKWGSEGLKDCALVTTMEPCAMCHLAAYQAEVRGIAFGVLSNEIRDAKPELLGSHKMAMVDLSNQKNWPFQVPYKQEQDFKEAILSIMTQYTRSKKTSLYMPPST